MPIPSSEHGCWPTATQRLLLRAALLEGDAGRAASRDWCAQVDLDHLDAGSQRLLPLLYRGMTVRGDAWRELGRLRGVARQAWYRNSLLIEQLAGVIAALDTAGIPTLVLEGAPLCLSYYQDVGLRPMTGADLIVPAAAASSRDLLPALAAAGWRLRGGADGWPPRFATARTFTGPLGLNLDLHGHVLNESRGSGDDDPFWDAAQPLEIAGVATRALHPSDELLYAVAHGVRRSAVPARWVADAAVIIRASGSRLDWPRFVHETRTRRLTRVAGRSLSYLKRWLDVPVPDDVLGSLVSSPQTLGERIECWAREEPGLTRLLAEQWSEFNRSAGRESDWSGPLGFPRYLRDRMGLTRLSQVPMAVARRIVHRRA